MGKAGQGVIARNGVPGEQQLVRGDQAGQRAGLGQACLIYIRPASPRAVPPGRAGLLGSNPVALSEGLATVMSALWQVWIAIRRFG